MCGRNAKVHGGSGCSGGPVRLAPRGDDEVDEEEKKIEEEGKHTKDGLGQLSANIQIVTVERQKIEQKVLSAASDRATINNAIEALKKPLKAVKLVRKIWRCSRSWSTTN